MPKDAPVDAVWQPGILDFATTNESGQIMFGFHAWNQKAWRPEGHHRGGAVLGADVVATATLLQTKNTVDLFPRSQDLHMWVPCCIGRSASLVACGHGPIRR
jgi:hypothetical protein